MKKSENGGNREIYGVKARFLKMGILMFIFRLMKWSSSERKKL